MSVFCPKTSKVAIGSDPVYVDPDRVRHVAFAQIPAIPTLTCNGSTRP